MQIIRCEQAGRKVTWLLCAAWLCCILVATGTSAADSRITITRKEAKAVPSARAEDIRISGKEVWRNEKKTLSKNVFVEKGGSLILEGTTLYFKCTKPKEYGIVVRGGGSLIVRKGSVVRGETNWNGTFIYAEGGAGHRHVEARDSSFIHIGTSQAFYLDAWQRPGIRLTNTDSTSGFWNCTFNGGSVIAAQWVSGLRIEGNTFRYTKQENSRCGAGVFLGKGCGPVYIHRNTFDGMRYALYTQFTHDVQFTNNVLKNCCYPHVKRGGYAIDLWGKPENDLYIAFNKLLNVEKNIVLNEYIQDILVEYNYINNTQVHAYGTALTLGNNHNRRNVMRRNTSDSNQSSGGMATNPNYGQGLGRFLIYDCRLADVRGSAGLIPIGADMVFSNISFSLARDDRWGGKWTGLAAIVSKRKVHCERNIFRNLSFSNFMTGMLLQGARDCVFCDIRLDKIKKAHVQFDGGNSNLKIINLKFDSARVSFKDDKDVFRPYWYAEVLVTDAKGKPVEGAKVTVTNEVDPAVGAINRKGEATGEFLTGKDGHTARPGAAVKHDLTSKPFVLEPGKPHQFAGWLRARGDRGENMFHGTSISGARPVWDGSKEEARKKKEENYVKAYAILYEIDGEGKPIAGHPLYVRGKSKWVLRKDSFTTLPQTRKGRVELFVYGWGDHAAWFDDLSVKGEDGKNLLTDPGFEAGPGDGNWPAPDGHTAVLDGTEKHSGKRSCKLVCRTWAAEDAGTMALCGYSQNKAGKTNYTYTITAVKGDLCGSKTGVKSDAKWYRKDPTKPPVTIRVTLK